jgi:hypothetical protein
MESPVCINLRERVDKLKRASRVFERLNLRVNFYRPEKHALGGRVGCFESHVSVIDHHYKRGSKYVVIFEDDIVPTHKFHKKDLSYYCNFLDQHPEIQYLQLGYTILPHEIKDYVIAPFLDKRHKVVKYCGNTTHAYILSRSGMEKVLSTWRRACYEEELHIDLFYKDIFQETSACSCPLYFDQDFCLENNNEPASAMYYIALRRLSCAESKMGLFYDISLLKRTYVTWILLILLFGLLLKKLARRKV